MNQESTHASSTTERILLPAIVLAQCRVERQRLGGDGICVHFIAPFKGIIVDKIPVIPFGKAPGEICPCLGDRIIARRIGSLTYGIVNVIEGNSVVGFGLGNPDSAPSTSLIAA